jgi:hypothetical protein
VGTVGGLGTAWFLSFLFIDPRITSGIIGILTAIVIFGIASIIAGEIEAEGCLYLIIALILAYQGGSFLAGRIYAFLKCYELLPIWLYLTGGMLGLTCGVVGGNFFTMMHRRQPVRKTLFSSAALIMVPLSILIFMVMLQLPLQPVRCPGYRAIGLEFWFKFFQAFW